LGWTLALLLVPIIIVGILVAKHVLWFTMPTVAYEKGGSSFRLSAMGGQAVSTDFDLVRTWEEAGAGGGRHGGEEGVGFVLFLLE